MKVKEIEFIGRIKPKEVVKLDVSNGWSAPTKLPVPIRFNNVLCTHFNMSEYGAIRFTQATGNYHYWSEDKKLPSGIAETDKGFMVVPWGEPMRLRGCGVSVEMWEDNGTIVIEYKTKSTYDSKRVYMFRVEFPVREHNVVRVYYYHCVSGYDTYVGAVLKPDDFVSWPMKENQPYMKKALEFTCSSEVEAPSREGFESVHTPFGEIWKQLEKPSSTIWETLFETETLKLLSKNLT